MSASFEQSYYENPELWRAEQFDAVQAERVRVTLGWVPDDTGSVLDLGCGNGILTNELTGRWRSAGMDRSRAALRWVRAPRAQADVTRVPIRDGAFDCVICTEVIEHLPLAAYDAALEEMSRVARRYIIVGVPYCEDLRTGQVSCPGCGCRFHANYHMRSFDRPALERLFARNGAFDLVRAEGISSRRTYRFTTLWLALRELRIRARTLPGFPAGAQCPQCGYGGGSPQAGPAQGHNSGAVSGAARLWPKRHVFRWWLALYRRREPGKAEQLSA